MKPGPVSLLVPCHNAAAHLPGLWATVRAQTRPFDECLCYDDASTDDTAAVARGLGATVLTGERNRGAAHARNQLWRAAQGEWVHFHDADDLLAPAYLERVAARAAADVDVVICNARWLFADTREVEMEWSYSEAALRADPPSYLLQHPVGGINGLYRRSVLESVGGFDERLSVWEDADLHVRLALAGARFAVVEEPLVTALRRRDSLSAAAGPNWCNRLRALRHYADTFPAAGRPALLAELEIAALRLLRAGEPAAAREALALGQSLGGDPPTTRNRLLGAVKRTLGPMAALRVQCMVRPP